VDNKNGHSKWHEVQGGSVARGLTVMQHDEPSLAFARRWESSCRTA
jgi:hypothetical protein